MGRYVHMELWAALAVLTGTAVGVAAGAGLREEPPVRGDAVGAVAAVALGFLVVAVLFRTSRLKWVGEVREFEAAVPQPDPRPTTRSRSYGVRLLALFVPAALFASFFADTGVALVPLVMALDWLAKAVAGARWERANGRVLWRGGFREEPWRLSYSTLSPRPGTRTATGAPPA
jgi:hypothetical protein